MTPSATLRIGIDATPLLGPRTGIGVYTQRLVQTLPTLEDRPELVATAFTLRGREALPAAVSGPGSSDATDAATAVTTRARPVPARLLRAAWARFEAPPVEWLCGRVDVFHGTNFVLPPTARARGVVTVHDLCYLRFPDTVSADSLRYRELVPRSVRRASVVCALSEAMADEVAAEYRIARNEIVVTSPGVDTTWFDARAPDELLRRQLSLPERYLLAVGTLEPRKNLPVLLEALLRLRATDPDAPALVLSGPPGWGPSLQLDRLPAGAVILTGYLDTTTLQRVVAGAAGLAFPSRYEGFGIPPLEALACGTPVLAADLPVTREVLANHATLVTGGDPDSWADAIARLLAAPPSAAARQAGQAHARRYSWHACAAAALTAYRRAAS
ncbi:MAG: glycosyltransferase family 4 protein [Actinomycetia bacterium]|nr:glycosyltransferase family 4 protein [Actinomycetes bacterium]